MTEPRPILDQINLVVADMDATVAFYRLLGLDIPDTLPEWQPHHRNAVMDGFDLDFDSATFAAKWNQGWPAGARRHGRARIPRRDA